MSVWSSSGQTSSGGGWVSWTWLWIGVQRSSVEVAGVEVNGRGRFYEADDVHRSSSPSSPESGQLHEAMEEMSVHSSSRSGWDINTTPGLNSVAV